HLCSFKPSIHHFTIASTVSLIHKQQLLRDATRILVAVSMDAVTITTGWHNKYGWAVALIVIFCILVVIAVAIWLIVWLINRAKDKRQKRE
ncbi:hypothetical protein NECAME_17726, partial [Necator americanus]